VRRFVLARTVYFFGFCLRYISFLDVNMYGYVLWARVKAALLLMQRYLTVRPFVSPLVSQP